MQTNTGTSDGDSVSLSVQNAAANNDAVVYINTSATLNVALTNTTGGDITLPPGCTLEIYMPSYFSAAEVQAMGIDTISQAGWNFTNDSTDTSLLLTWGNTKAGSWSSGATLTFNITGVLSNAQPDSDTVQVNFNDLTGNNIPAQVSTILVLSNPVIHGNVNLDTVLKVETEFEGVVYVSVSSDPLTNTVYLNFKNTGVNPLYNGSSMWSGSPRVLVSFAYGNTSGALAPDDKSGSGDQDSAWNISGTVSVDQTGGWNIQNPSPSGQYNSPVWVLRPADTNLQIIGTGDSSNVTFAFSNIFSFTPTGATQMYVQFTGFTQDENNTYNDELFTVSLYKQSAPDNRGILSLNGPAVLYVMNTETLPVTLNWTGFEIASINLQCNAVPTPPPYTKSYSDTSPLVYDSTTFNIASASPGDEVIFTLQGLDGNGNVLNSPQFTVSVEQQAAVYAFSGPGASTPFTLNQPVTISLDWKIYNAASIEITSASSSNFTRSYPSGTLWLTDSASIAVNGLNAAQPSVTFTLNAYDANGVLLNSMQCTVDFMASLFIDPKDQQSYGVVVINGVAWLADNYQYNDPAAFYLENNSGTLDEVGRFYTFATVQADVPAGWRLSTWQDWTNLIAYYGSTLNAYNQLMTEGGSGFNASTYAYLSIDGQWLPTDALYWAVDQNGTTYGVQFSSLDQPTVYILNASSFYGPIVACTVRYVLNDPNAEPAATQTKPEHIVKPVGEIKHAASGMHKLTDIHKKKKTD